MLGMTQGAAHTVSGEVANLPELAKRSGPTKISDELGHVVFFPLLCCHTVLESMGIIRPDFRLSIHGSYAVFSATFLIGMTAIYINGELPTLPWIDPYKPDCLLEVNSVTTLSNGNSASSSADTAPIPMVAPLGTGFSWWRLCWHR